MLPEHMKIVAIQNYSTSGSLLMHSLFDRHPNVAALPGLIGQMYFSAMLRRMGEDLVSVGELAATTCEYFDGLFDPEALIYTHGLKNLGENCDEHASVDSELFQANFIKYVQYLMKRQHLRPVFGRDEAGAYLCLMYHAVCASYAEATGQDPSQQNVLVYAIHSGPPWEAQILQEHFQEAYFLHMVRSPIENMDSGLKYYTHHQKYQSISANIFHCAVSQIFQDHAPHANLNEKLCSIYEFPGVSENANAKSFAVRLEALHTEPEKVMSLVCEELGIEWDACLLQSTFAGKIWWNRPGLKKVTGFNPSITNRKSLTYFSDFDRWRLEVLAEDLRVDLGYTEPQKGAKARLLKMLAKAALIVPFRLEWEVFQGVRGVYVYYADERHKDSAKAQDYVAVALAYWDAARKKTVMDLPVIDAVEEAKPENQRILMLYRENTGKIQTRIINFDGITDVVPGACLYIDPADDVPKLTPLRKLMCALAVFGREYVYNRRKLCEGLREAVARRAETVRPLC